ncbi:MAG: zinc-binding alcohol dehydrogenase [Neomegalonema sp.]|nr:zinc-binding alcohol dehydrogenase [Neomegalonema sp.]
MIKQLKYAAPHAIEIERAPNLAQPRSDEAHVRTLFSLVSRGTERLVYEGRLPESEYQRMRAPFQVGDFPYPVIYGYSAVAEVIDGPAEWLGRRVFALAPHRSEHVLPLSALTPLPDAAPSKRAALAANMETALNVLWDAGAGPGDRIAVVGCGVVGALIGSLAARLPGAEALMIDPQPGRRLIAEQFGADFAAPAEAPADFNADIVVHASATDAGLETSLTLAGMEGAVIEASWNGAGRSSVPLGGAFHSQRLRLISSQVGQIAPSRRPRWSYGRRLAKAVELLCDPRYDAFITREIAFEAAAQELPDAFNDSAELGVVLDYQAGA